ncbi:MAG: two-component regulator propeller domain-containing protein [Dysgonomonas sp.]
MKHKFIILFFVCSLIAKADKAYYKYLYQQALSQSVGLVSNDVNCILQDSKGFMWFGTNNGLSRYDGYMFKTYKSNYLNPNLFSNNIIRCLAEDQSHRLWIGTAKGINVINLLTGSVTSFDSEIKNLDINAVAVSANNTIYFGTDEGLYFFDERTKNFNKIELIRQQAIVGNLDYIKTIFIDSKNYMWIGGWEAGYLIYNLNTNVFVEYPYLKDLESLTVNHIFEDSSHNIWLSTWSRYGVWRIENPHQPVQSQITNFLIQKSQKSTFDPVVYAIREEIDSKNIVLATSDGIQIIKQPDRYVGSVIVDGKISDKLSSDDIFTLFTDRTGLIWYSVQGLGVNALSPDKTHFEQYNLSKMIDRNNLQSSVTAVYQDESGLLWLGLKSFVLGLFDQKNNVFKLYNNDPVLKKISSEANSIYAFYKPPTRDELWLGTRYDGLYIVRLNKGKVTSVHKQEIIGVNPKNLAVRSIIEDTKTHTVWIGTNRGLAYAKYNEITRELICEYYKPVNVSGDLKKSESINSLIIDKARNLWVSTYDNGIFKCVTNGSSIINIEHYSFQNGKVNNNDVLCCFQDHKQRIWIGTRGGGLSLYDNHENRFSIIDNMSMMPDDAVYAINEDNWGNLWFATGNGLVSYNNDFEYDERIKVFSVNDGLNINAFNQNATFQNNKNELFYGGKNGLITFVPQKREINALSLSPIITDVFVANISIDKLSERKRRKISNKEIAYTDKLNFSYDQNNIQIDFSNLQYQSNASIKYEYQLEGIDKKWIYLNSNKNSVNYNNLSRGKYIFRIKSTNSDGVWCQTPATLNIVINPAPWNTLLAYVIYAILLTLLIISVLRFVFNQLRLRRMLAIEQIEREKSEEVHQAKLKFFTNISHEFFTPITIIKFGIEDLIDKNKSNNNLLQTMKVNTNRLERLLEQIIEFRKIETGNMKLKLTQIEFVSFIKELCEIHFAPFVLNKNISFEFSCKYEKIVGYADRDKIDKIMYNLLSNAIKYNKEKGNIHVTLDLINQNDIRQLFITVEDTGCGMSKDVQQNIFKRFYEGNFRNFKVKSIGIGLSLTYDLVKLHDGDITVESEENVGSKFSVTIPIDRKEHIEDVAIIPELKTTNYYLTHDNEVGRESEDTGLKVLIVEDNKDLLELMSNTLRQEFVVLQSENGKEALDLLEKNYIDILVTDVLMPEMDGFELVAEMKQNVKFSHIPIIILSARHNIESKIEGYQTGADSYITKPFEMPILTANIKSLVKNRKLQAQSFSSNIGGIDVSQYVHNDTDKEFLEKVIETIETNILEKEDFTTTDLYETFHMSQSTFYRKLQTLIGVSPNELIKKVKINIACKILLEGNLNVSEIAYSLGFNDPKYFSHIFKKEMGVIPSMYAEEHEKKKIQNLG